MIEAFVSSFNDMALTLNSSKYFAGIMMLLLNIGGKYISMELSDTHEKLLNNKLIRRIFIFVLIFIATRDVKVSLILTAVFIILVSGIFNEESKFCIIPNQLCSNKKIRKDQYQHALYIVNTYKKQNNMK